MSEANFAYTIDPDSHLEPSYYLNPVTDLLTLSNDREISRVDVNNILGQNVFSKAVNGAESQIDMSNLSKGIYLVHAFCDDQRKIVKIIRQ
jgi:type IX secretion system substrate protein